jgi:hypothetical protein
MIPYDPEFDVPVKIRKERLRARLDRRSFSLILVLIAVWLGIVWDTDLFWMTLVAIGCMLSGVLVIGLALIPSALGFALFGICGRLVAYCRRKREWPDEESEAGPI